VLGKLGPRGTTSYLERPGEADWTRRWHAIYETKRRRDLEREEQVLLAQLPRRLRGEETVKRSIA
jgi:hypothetical protein